MGSPVMRTVLLLVLIVTAAVTQATPRAFTVQDLVMMERVSDPHVSPDARYVSYTLRETDLANNKGVTNIWLLDLRDANAAPRKITSGGASDARWSTDGKSLYFLSQRSGSNQVWRLDLAGGEAQQVTNLPLDVSMLLVSPDGKHLALSMDVFIDCSNLACTKKRIDENAARKSTGVLYEKLFIRHWDTWADGTRSQLFVAAIDQTLKVSTEPVRISKGIDGDVPSKPFGDSSEVAFAPDGKSMVFSARIAGSNESISTNFDLYRVAIDGSDTPHNLTPDNLAWDTGPVFSPDCVTLYYKAMKRAGFEADRLGIMVKNLNTGTTHELLPKWDYSADGMQLSADGKTLYVTAEDTGQKSLFAIDTFTGKLSKLINKGTVSAFDVNRDTVVYALDSLTSPDQLYRISGSGGAPTQLTHHNEQHLAEIRFGEPEQFSFSGWHNENVHGYIVKPWNYEKGKKYPTVFLIHGGPQGSFGNDFHYRWNPQTYAGQGYAVVMVDFHGSTGYGQAFTDSISGDWGGKPLEDLRKGWQYALAHYDFLDGNKAAALGASYGGYMVNWIEGSWQGAFKCLVSHDGDFDDRMMAYATEEQWFSDWEHNGKTPYQDPASYERFSPSTRVANWKTPMLVIHSQKDYRIPIEQGIATFTALQRKGVPSELLVFPDENHWILKPHNSIQWHETVQAWLKRWIGE